MESPGTPSTSAPRGFASPGALAPRLRSALRRLDGLVDWERRERSGGQGRAMRVDLAPIRRLLAHLGNPERSFRAVHVAGTKGKGSVASLVGAGLRSARQRVGVYGSPHVERIHERIRLDGREIEDEPLAEALELVLAAHELTAVGAEGAGASLATWFDVLTATAFVTFRAAQLDWAVIECGLGGRLDSTNAVQGEVCVVTNIDLEHTAILGSTRAEIAAEKAGIFERGRPAVVGLESDSEAGRAVAKRAGELDVPVTWVPPQPEWSVERCNVELARAVLDATAVPGAELDTPEIAAARLPGRLEWMGGQRVPVALDGAHVPASLRAVLRDLGASEQVSGPPTVVLGLGRDKDAPGLLKVLQGHVDRVVCTSVGEGPVATPDELAALAAELGLQSLAIDAPRTALSRAIELAPEGGWVLVTGSLHLIGAVRGALGNLVSPCSRSSPTSS